MRGFYKGGLWGLVLGGAGLGFASLVNDLPEYAEGPSAPQLVTPELSLAVPSAAVSLQSGSDSSPGFSQAAPLAVTLDDAEAAPDVSTEPAALPQTADVGVAIETPAVTQGSDLSPTTDAPVTGQVETELAKALIENEAIVVDTTPAPALPVAPVAEVAPEEVAQQAEAVVPDAVVEDIPVESAGVETESVSELVVVPEEPKVPDAPVTQTEAVAVESETPATQAPAVVPEEESAPVVAETVVSPSDAPQAPTVRNLVPTEPEISEPTVAQALPQVTTTVRINRPGAADAPEPTPNETAEETVLPDDAPALLRFAAPFENPQGVPLISIILIDDGEMPDAVAAIADLGFVPTVAVNGLSPSSTALAEAYRAAGVEVAMRADLPDGAQPTDVEVSFEAALGLVPDVAMLFSDGTGAMQNRAVTAQVMQILADKGHGFVAVQRGLNNAARAAEQVNVPAATVLRDIDGAGEDSRAILRALDQAAFRARQSGDAVLLGRVTPQTLSALRDWAGDLDRDTLMIAPVSAILLTE